MKIFKLVFSLIVFCSPVFAQSPRYLQRIGIANCCSGRLLPGFIFSAPATYYPGGFVPIVEFDALNQNFFLDGAGNTLNPSTGVQNIGDGVFNLSHLTTGSYNQAFGYESLVYDTTGSWNSACGYQVLFTNTTGSNNSGIGYSSLLLNTTGNQNNGLGSYALMSNTTGSGNNALGYYSMQANLDGSWNTSLGNGTMNSLLHGSYNTAIGFQALGSPTSINGCIGLGKDAGYYCTTSNEFYVNNQDWASNANEKKYSMMFGTMAPTPTSDTLNTPGTFSANKFTVQTTPGFSGDVTISGGVTLHYNGGIMTGTN